MSTGEKLIGALVGTVVLALLLFWIFWANCVNFIDSYNLGYSYDSRSGKIEILNRTGYFVTSPFVSVHHIDLRPGQICMNANSRVLNCKLVRFNPEGFDKFIEWHGRGAGDGGYIYEILKSYAFNVNEGHDCPFLTILDDMRRKNPSLAEPAR